MSKRFGHPNIPLLIISVLLSLTLWVIVQAENMQLKTSTLTVPLRVDNLDPKYVITEIDDTVSIQVEGPGDKLNDPGLKNAQALVDLKNAAPGRKMYNAIIEAPDPQVQRLLPRDYSKVLIRIEAKASKSFPVIVEPKGRISDRNLRYDVSEVEPAVVTFSGSQSRVDSIVRARVMLDLGEIDPNDSERTFSLPIEAFDDQGRPVPYVAASTTFIRVHPTVEPATVDKELFILPQFIGRPAPGYGVVGYVTSPDKVTVTGSSLTLAQTSSIRTFPIDVTGISGLTIRETTLLLPEDLKPMHSGTYRVRIFVQKQEAPKATPPVPAPNQTPAFPDHVPPLVPIKGGSH